MYKVSVGLEAEMAGFIPEIGAAIAITEKFDHTVEGLDRSINKLPIDSARAAAAMKLLNGDVTEFGNRVTTMGNKSAAMSIVDQRIRSTRTEMRKLMDEFKQTGDLDIFKRISKSQGNLNALTSIRKQLTSEIEKAAVEGGASLENAFSNGIRGAFTNPYVLAAAGGLALALGPLIGSAIGGAIIAAGALGVAAAGVVGAVKADPKAIGAAWHTEISKIKTEWIDASIAFVKPTIAAVHTIGGAVRDIHLGEILQKAATFVAPLAQGIAGFVTGIGKAISALVAGAGPVIDALKTALPRLGQDIATSFALIAGGGRGAAKGLSDVLDFTGRVIVGIGAAIRVTEELYQAFKSAGEAARSMTDGLPQVKWLTDRLSPKPVQEFAVSLDGAAHGLKTTADQAQVTQENLSKLMSTIHKTAVSTDTLAAAMVHKLFTATMGLQEAELAFNSSLLDVDDSLKQNGRTLDSHTRKGIANQHAILSSVTANMELYQAQVAAGMSSVDAAHNYDVNTAALERQLRKAGLTSSQIDGLIGRYRKVPANVNTAIAINGLTDAINGLADLLRQINHIPKLHITEIRTVFTSSGTLKTGQSRNAGQTGEKGLIRMDRGGALVGASNPGTFLFAEPQTGGEAFIPLRGITQNRAMGLAQVVGDNYGFDVTSRYGRDGINITIGFGRDTDGAFASAFMGLVRTGKIQFRAG